MASSFLRYLDHTRRRITVGRTLLDEWLVRRRDLYLTTHNTYNRKTSMPTGGFEPTISAGEWPQTYALDRAATGTGFVKRLLTYSMVQSPSWAANWFAASQEIPRISRNPKVHYRTHKRPPPVSILGQPNPVHIPTSHLLEFHPNIIHPSTSRSPQWSISLRFPQQDPIYPPLLIHTRQLAQNKSRWKMCRMCWKIFGISGHNVSECHYVERIFSLDSSNPIQVLWR